MSKSFILYQEYQQNLKMLSQEQKGDLLDAIFAFNQGEEINLEPLVNMAFSFIKSDLIRNRKKYDNIVERNKINGSKGGRPSKPKKPSGLIGNPKKPKETLNDNDNVNDNVNDKEDKKTKAKKAMEEMLMDESKKAEARLKDKIIIPEWIDSENWNEWMKIRIKKKASNSQVSIKTILNKLIKWKEKGYDPNLIIEESMLAGWSSVYEPKAQSTNNSTYGVKF